MNMRFDSGFVAQHFTQTNIAVRRIDHKCNKSKAKFHGSWLWLIKFTVNPLNLKLSILKTDELNTKYLPYATKPLPDI